VLDDWWKALGWFAALYPPEIRPRTWQPGDMSRVQKIIVWRSLDPHYSWRAIGDMIGQSNEWARRRYQAAIDQVWEMANEI
jgi:hypothetical protein